MIPSYSLYIPLHKYLWFPVPNKIPLMALGVRSFKYWIPGISGHMIEEVQIRIPSQASDAFTRRRGGRGPVLRVEGDKAGANACCFRSVVPLFSRGAWGPNSQQASKRGPKIASSGSLQMGDHLEVKQHLETPASVVEAPTRTP